MIKLKKYKKVTVPFNATIILYPPVKLKNRKWDTDNRVKALLDALQRFDVIEDDCLLRRLVVDRGEPTSSGSVLLTIESCV
jgi:Holliday junction resolvase RusA-like endonuclease